MDYIERDLDDHFCEENYPKWLASQIEAFIQVYHEYYERYGKDEYEDVR